MVSLTIVFDEANGECVRDSEVEALVDNLIKASKVGKVVYTIGQELIVCALRVAIKTGKIPSSEVVLGIQRGDKFVQLELNDKGRVSPWPEEFNTNLNLLQQL